MSLLAAFASPLASVVPVVAAAAAPAQPVILDHLSVMLSTGSSRHHNHNHHHQHSAQMNSTHTMGRPLFAIANEHHHEFHKDKEQTDNVKQLDRQGKRGGKNTDLDTPSDTKTFDTCEHDQHKHGQSQPLLDKQETERLQLQLQEDKKNKDTHTQAGLHRWNKENDIHSATNLKVSDINKVVQGIAAHDDKFDSLFTSEDGTLDTTEASQVFDFPTTEQVAHCTLKRLDSQVFDFPACSPVSEKAKKVKKRGLRSSAKTGIRKSQKTMSTQGCGEDILVVRSCDVEPSFRLIVSSDSEDTGHGLQTLRQKRSSPANLQGGLTECTTVMAKASLQTDGTDNNAFNLESVVMTTDATGLNLGSEDDYHIKDILANATNIRNDHNVTQHDDESQVFDFYVPHPSATRVKTNKTANKTGRKTKKVSSASKKRHTAQPTVLQTGITETEETAATAKQDR